MDKSIRDPDLIAQTLKTEVLGALPMVPAKDFRMRLALTMVGPGAPVIVNGSANGNGHGLAAKNGVHGSLTQFEESVRTLHSSILMSDLVVPIRSVLLTSTAPAEGKTTTAAYLAISNAEQGHPTLLIDADLRRPGLHRLFGVTPLAGLSNVLLGEMEWRQAITRLEGHPNLHFLASGPSSRRAPDLIGRGLAALIEEAEREYSLVVVDSPPFLNFAEPLRMSTMVGGVLLVASAGQTDRQAAATVLATLKRVRANVVGLVLNRVTPDLTRNYHYYGYHGYYGAYYKRYTVGEEHA